MVQYDRGFISTGAHWTSEIASLSSTLSSSTAQHITRHRSIAKHLQLALRIRSLYDLSLSCAGSVVVGGW